MLPGPAEEIAGIDVARVGVGGTQDYDDELAAVALAPRDKAGTGGGRGAGFDPGVTVDGEELVGVFPDNVALVAAAAGDRGAVLAGVDVLAEEPVLHRGVGEVDEVSGRGLVALGGEAVRVFVVGVGHA